MAFGAQIKLALVAMPRACSYTDINIFFVVNLFKNEEEQALQSRLAECKDGLPRKVPASEPWPHLSQLHR